MVTHLSGVDPHEIRVHIPHTGMYACARIADALASVCEPPDKSRSKICCALWEEHLDIAHTGIRRDQAVCAPCLGNESETQQNNSGGSKIASKYNFVRYLEIAIRKLLKAHGQRSEGKGEPITVSVPISGINLHSLTSKGYRQNCRNSTSQRSKYFRKLTGLYQGISDFRRLTRKCLTASRTII